MDPSTAIQLRKRLESLKEFQRLNAPSRFAYFGYLGEVFVGAIILGMVVVSRGMLKIAVFGIPHFAEWAFLIIALILMSHGLYLIFRYHSDKRIRKILEAVFSDTHDEQPVSSPK